MRLLRSADARRAHCAAADHFVRALQSAQHRLNPFATSKKGPSLEAVAELLSAGTASELMLVEEASPLKGFNYCMRELVQIDSLTDHACGQPSIERWHVLEPVSGRWSWMRVFGCCNQVVIEEDDSEVQQPIKRAA